MMKKARQLAKLIERQTGGREVGMQVDGSCGGGREENENAPT